MVLRFLIRLILLDALFTATVAYSQRLDSRRSSGFHAIDVGHLRADLAFLASPDLEGRMTLYRGSRLAALFVATEFAKAGLRPANNASYLQEFPVPEDVAEQIFRAAGTGADVPSGPDPPYSAQPRPPFTSVNVIGVLEGSDRALEAEAAVDWSPAGVAQTSVSCLLFADYRRKFVSPRHPKLTHHSRAVTRAPR